MEVLKQSENKLLGREDMSILFVHEGKPTPKRIEIRAEIAGHFGAEEGRVIVDRIDTKTGQNISVIHAQVYKDTGAIPKQKAGKMNTRINGPKKKEAKKDK